jgi:hypothetical protein
MQSEDMPRPSFSETLSRLNELNDVLAPVEIRLRSQSGLSEVNIRMRILFVRAYAWLNTQRKLNKALDVQAIATGARFFLELAVDLVLLNADPTNTSKKMQAWEDSARLAQAERICRFPGGDKQGHHARFIKERADEIYRMRTEIWHTKMRAGKPDHPHRWTNKELHEDVKNAAKYLTNPSDDLEAAYGKIHGALCWFVHGSSILPFSGPNMNLRNMQNLCSSVNVLSLPLCILCAKVILGHEGMLDPDTARALESLKYF